MRKLDLILENIRDEYMINLLEEGASSELEALKTKKFLSENLNRVRTMLVEEGVMEGVKQHLGDNWGKYLAGATATGLGVHGADVMGVDGQDVMEFPSEVANAAHMVGPAAAGAAALGAGPALVGAGAGDLIGKASDAMAGDIDMQQIGDKLIDAAGNIYDAAGQMLGNISTGIQDLAGKAQEAMAPEAPEVPEVAQNVPGTPRAGQ